MSQLSVQRVIHSDKFWHGQVKKQLASGLSIKEYCRRCNLAFSTFWRKRRNIMAAENISYNTKAIPAGKKVKSSLNHQAAEAVSRKAKVIPGTSDKFVELGLSEKLPVMASVTHRRQEHKTAHNLSPQQTDTADVRSVIIKLPSGITLEVLRQCDMQQLGQVIELCQRRR